MKQRPAPFRSSCQRAVVTLSAVLALLATSLSARAEDTAFIALCFHDVRHVSEPHLSTDTITINTNQLVAQLEWLRSHGYQAVRIGDIIDAKAGKKPLPPKAVLLTFDDGYDSFFSQVYPLLQFYQMPAVLGLVTSWMEKGPSDSIEYTATPIPRQALLNWDQVRSMVKSGWVEVASHSHDLHRGIMANPQGNTQPAASTRRYDAQLHHYESDDEYRARIQGDLTQSIAIIERETGAKPRALIWPFGSFTGDGVSIAQKLGMAVTMGLTDGRNATNDVSALRRFLVRDGATLSDLAWDIHNVDYRDPRRAVFLRLDTIYDPDPAVQENNLGAALERIKQLGSNAVIVLPLADADANGLFEEAYFANDQLPLRTDLFNRTAWQLRTRTHAKVYAWTPVYGFGTAEDSGAVVDVARLYGAMAKHADFFGAVVELDPRPTSATPPRMRGADIKALINDMKRHRPELITAVMTDAAVTDQLLTGSLPLGVRDAYAAADMALLSAPTLWQDDAALDRFAAQLAALPNGRGQTIVMLPPRTAQASAATMSELAARSARKMLARGIKSFALADDTFLRDDAALAAAKRSLSLISIP